MQFNSIYFTQIILWYMRCYIQDAQMYATYIVHVSYDKDYGGQTFHIF